MFPLKKGLRDIKIKVLRNLQVHLRQGCAYLAVLGKWSWKTGNLSPPAFSQDKSVFFQLFHVIILLTDPLMALRSLCGSPKYAGGPKLNPPCSGDNSPMPSTPSTDSQIQTFLSFSEPSVRRTPLACMCRYRTRCSADMSHLITYSTCQDPTGSHTQPLWEATNSQRNQTQQPAQTNPATTAEQAETPPAHCRMGKSRCSPPSVVQD